MTWPFTFGTATSPVAASNLDTMFNQTAAMTEIPCSVTGVNALALSPLPNCPALPSYTELGGYRFRAAGNSSAAVTASYNGLAFLPVYHADGTTQCGTGDLTVGFQYVVRFSQALNGGAGGFFLESPAVAVTGTQPWGLPGGRLSLQATVPVMTSSLNNQQIIYYVPYNHQWVPIYNGSIMAPYQFSSPITNQGGPSLNMGGAANWPTNAAYDIFCYLNAGVPSLCGVQWTNNTTRQMNLATIGGVLTNAGAIAAGTGPNTSFTLPQNQGTFLGSIYTSTQGATQFLYAGNGLNASMLVSNYYNKVQFSTAYEDNGTAYTYSSGTIRQWRNISNAQIGWMASDSERTQQFAAVSTQGLNSGFTCYVGMGVNTTTGFNQYVRMNGPGANFYLTTTAVLNVNSTGFLYVTALEQGDGANAVTFDLQNYNWLLGLLWL